MVAGARRRRARAVRDAVRAPRPAATACTPIGRACRATTASIVRAAARRCSTSRAPRCAASGPRRRTRMQRCATTRPAPTRSRRRASTATIPGCRRTLTFDPDDDVAAPFVARARRAPARRHPARAGRERSDRDGGGLRPRRLRGHRRAHERHPRAAASTWRDFRGLAACGGFSYGDVLGAGEGWAKSILFNARARDAFAAFFARPDTFTLGVCNGCQMMSDLQRADPGRRRLAALRAQPQRAVRGAPGAGRASSRARRCCFAGMAGSRLPIAVAHGEGRAEFDRRRRAPRARGERPGRRPLRRPPRRAPPSATPRTPTARPAASPP